MLQNKLLTLKPVSMLMKLPLNQSNVYQQVIETKEGKIIFMRFLQEWSHIQGSGSTEQISQQSLIAFLHLVLTYTPN
jgi:hypothetical protein